MTTQTFLTILFSLVGCIICILTFFAGQKSGAKKDGMDKGTIITKLDYITDDIKEIKATQKVHGENYTNLHADMGVIKRDLSTAFTLIDKISDKK